MSEDSVIRLEKNPLRILDSKNEHDQKIAKDAPKISDYYTDDARRFFDEVLEILTLYKVEYNINPNLVRGLDYYCHTAFEFITGELGAQGTVLGGGRYDGLVELMGGAKTAGIGFAAGIERIMMMLEENNTSRPNVVVVFGEKEVEKQGIILAKELRESGFCIINDYDISAGKKMKRANKINAKFAFIIGQDELDRKVVKIKDLDSGKEIEAARDQIVEIIKNIK